MPTVRWLLGGGLVAEEGFQLRGQLIAGGQQIVGVVDLAFEFLDVGGHLRVVGNRRVDLLAPPARVSHEGLVIAVDAGYELEVICEKQ